MALKQVLRAPRQRQRWTQSINSFLPHHSCDPGRVCLVVYRAALVVRVKTSPMLPAVALRKRPPRLQLRQEALEDQHGSPRVMVVEPQHILSDSRVVYSADRPLSIVNLAFQFHHITVVGIKGDFQRQVKQVHGT